MTRKVQDPAASRIVEQACRLVSSNMHDQAAKLVAEEYPHNFRLPTKRTMNEYEKLRVFLRDGFIDRYSGKRLFFPPVLRLLSSELKEVFPFQKNWKMSECHIAYWDLMPTYDHIIPVARGGKEEESNIVTTSQSRNSAKANFLLEEIHWKTYKPGRLNSWNGMIDWYTEFVSNRNHFLVDPYIKIWDQALWKCISEKRIEVKI